ncbi:MAG: membrane protein [Paracoccaceae bacterium]|nr:MAG: DUF3429 domain-containing protein [Alphaproteobacteria bacterium]GIX13550.1 MAG: membrane protein [Paracoccaceae bacterium]
MARIPSSALWLGLAGLIPFLYGAVVAGGLVAPPADAFAARPVLTAHGAVILGFLGGALWGFACAGGRRPGPRELSLAVLPALWGFAAMFHPRPLLSLALGLVLTLAVDMMAVLRGTAPGWWLSLRLPLTAVAVACLLAGALA